MNNAGTESTTRAECKRKLRRQLRSVRLGIDKQAATKAAHSVASRLQELEAWSPASCVGSYLSLDGELDTTGIAARANRDGKRYFLPVVKGDQIIFRRWSPGQPLVANRFGIGEPEASIEGVEGAEEVKKLDVLLVPVVGWASNGARLGMGGGFYDRFLADDRNRVGCRIGLAFEAQRDERIADVSEPWDQALDGVITECGFYDFRQLTS